jgi:glucuronosyltransferase
MCTQKSKIKSAFGFFLQIKPSSCPDNVLILDWLPQQEIMAHPKTILFFTHFGMHGALEAVWYGLPMVGIPLFADQGDVRTKVEEQGIGRGLDMFASAKEIHDAIIEVRDNPK